MLGMLSRGRAPAGRGTDPDAAVARRVGWRLAALTVGLIAALLLVLGVAVYGTMQHVLLQSLQDTVWQRTTGFLQSGRLPGPPGGPGRPPPFRRPRRSAIGDVRFTIANQRLHVLPSADPGTSICKRHPGVHIRNDTIVEHNLPLAKRSH